MRFPSFLIVSCIVAFGVLQSSAAAQEKSPESSAPRINKFVQRMEQGEPAFGVFASNVSTRSGANMASSGLDFVIIDMEHSPYDVTRLEGYLLGMINKRDLIRQGLQMPTAPLVRVPANGREQLQFVIKQVLDLGAVGVVVPHVDTAEDARAAVQASRFPQLTGAADFQPEGKRGVGYGWAARYWGLSGTDYARRADLWPLDPQGELVLWVMIETKLSVENIHEIAATPGIGGLFIGPSDLAFSLGVPLGDPAVEAAIETIVEAAKEADVPLGTLCGRGQVEKRLAQGFRFLAVGGDAGLSGAVKEAVSIGRAYKAE
ncbi:MAG: HpcH/HpaI aldolase/citrate lyase family protein [Novipirellula sp. JB048]